METLTIIAYQQPLLERMSKLFVVFSRRKMIRQLIDRGLVRVAGEDDSLGRPFLYETTRQFLSMFGLQKLDDMPNYSTLRRQSARPVLSAGDEDEADNEVPQAASH